MFCKNCGTKLEDDAVFCSNCGTKVDSTDAPAPAPTPAPTPTPVRPVDDVNRVGGSKLSSYITGKAVIVVALVVVLGIVLSIGLKLSKKINLDKYVEVSYEGYDSLGNASWSFNYEKFDKDYGKKIKINRSKLIKELKEEGIDPKSVVGQEYIKETKPVDIIRGMVRGSLDKSNNLTNGDEIVFTWNIDEDEDYNDYINYKISYSEDIKFKVSGLEQLGSFDPFSGIELKYSGIAPNGSAELDIKNKSGVYGDIGYRVEPQYGLSVGDTVVVSAYAYYDDLAEYTAREYGVIPSATEKEYTVDCLSEYVTKVDDISESMLDSMKSQGEDVLRSKATNWDESASIGKIEYEGCYLLSGKSENVSPFNKATMVYKVTVDVDKSVDDKPDVHDSFSYYYPVTYRELIKLEDGTVSTDITYYELPYDSIQKSYDFGGWWETNLYFDGYEKLDTLFNKLVTSNIERYTYDTDIED